MVGRRVVVGRRFDPCLNFSAQVVMRALGVGQGGFTKYSDGLCPDLWGDLASSIKSDKFSNNRLLSPNSIGNFVSLDSS